MKETPSRNVDEYLASQPAKFQQILHEMREIIWTLAPNSQELISYQVPCFKYLYMLVGLGVTKEMCSFYTMNPDLVKSMKQELEHEGVKFSGSTLYFSPDRALPVDLIKKIVRIRIAENEAKAKAKSNLLPGKIGG